MLRLHLARLRRGLDAVDPWTNVYGVARSLLAVSTATTLACNPTFVLFRPLAGHLFVPPLCLQTLQKVDLFCATPGPLAWRQALAAVLLFVVASGWRPRITGLLHWYVSLSFQLSATTLDGGDQAAAILTLLLLPLTLTDDRVWHWQARPKPEPVDVSEAERLARLVARAALFMIRLQVAGIYFHAATGKLKVVEWANGTALYYWLTHPVFGANDGWKALIRPLLVNAWSVSALTWGVIALELLLMMGLLATRRAQAVLLVGGIMLHASIMVLQGLFSFSLVMFAALIMYLRPTDEPFAWARVVRPRWFARPRKAHAPDTPATVHAPMQTAAFDTIVG